MFREDRCVTYAVERGQQNVELNGELLERLLDALAFTSETPPERIINAVKDEVEHLTSRAHAALQAVGATDATRSWHERALQILRPNTCYFPRDELGQFIGEIEGSGLLPTSPDMRA